LLNIVASVISDQCACHEYCTSVQMLTSVDLHVFNANDSLITFTMKLSVILTFVIV